MFQFLSFRKTQRPLVVSPLETVTETKMLRHLHPTRVGVSDPLGLKPTGTRRYSNGPLLSTLLFFVSLRCLGKTCEVNSGFRIYGDQQSIRSTRIYMVSIRIPLLRVITSSGVGLVSLNTGVSRIYTMLTFEINRLLKVGSVPIETPPTHTT